MTRYKNINGERIAFTTAEETARDNEETAAAVEKSATAYKTNRVTGIGTTVTGYGSIGEQLDQLYHDINAGKFGSDAKTGDWFVGISSVKTTIPKPS
tara:strand:- start:45 stop:335 length:291 start_codon:yes stop_codon:yes gene_type:complete